jgi:signal transduction histidine kinase
MSHQWESGYLSRMSSLYLRARWFWGGGLLLLPVVLTFVGLSVTRGWALSAAGGVILAHAIGMTFWRLEAVTSTIFVDLAVVHGAVLLMSIGGADHAVAILVMIGAAVIISLFTQGPAFVAAHGLNAALGLLNMTASDGWTLERLAAPSLGTLFLVLLIAVLLGSFRTRLIQLEMARALTLGIASHELRNHLTGVVGLTEVIRDGSLPADSPEVTGLLEMAHDEALEAAAVIEDLLTASRTERGILESHPVPTDISRIVEAMVGRPYPGRAGIITDGTDQPVWALADGLRVGQVMRNLLVNARRHGGPNVRISVRSAGGQVSIVVADDGEGVHPSDLPRLFLPYQAGRHDPTPESTGLGLWISRSLMHSMGGDLEYRRQAGQTVFEATLPASEPVG